MAMPSSCSHWWHAPIYLAATAVLIIASISSSFNVPTPSHDLISTLHHSGFHLTAITLQLSTTYSSSSPFTLFALPDSALSNLSFPAADHLLRLHTSPLPLPFSTLSSLPRGTSIPSLLPNHNLTLLIGNSSSSSAVAINSVPITRPNLFVGGPHVVHGVSAPFPPSFHYENVNWARVARALGSKGYVSFAMGLSSVLDSLPPLDHATVFAPRDREGGFDGYVAGAKDELERAVRRHVALGRLGYGELAAKRVGEEMGTLEKDWGLMITDGEIRNSNRAVVEVNGVEITEGEVYADDKVVVHGVTMAFSGDGNTTL